MLPRASWLGVAAAVALAGLGAGSMAARSQPGTQAEATFAGGAPTVRRLSERQYVRSIHDIFGSDITIPGRFEPQVREGGLLAIGDSKVAISSSGFEQYELRAREIAAQVLAEPKRKTAVPCASEAAQFDAGCASEVLGKYGRLLYRRPLSAAEMASIMAVTQAATAKSGKFSRGLQAGLARLLVSPNFIFRVEQAEADPRVPGQRRLTDHSLATRISFLLWDAPPDAELLDAAASGTLRDDAALVAQVDRMLASPRFEHGVRAFFSDMFGYEQFDAVSKDQAIYPIYSSQLAKDAQEQALRTIVDLLVTQKGDYRDIFTTRRTFMNRRLGGLYNVPVPADSVSGWAPYTFGEKDPRAGLLTLAGFLMLDVTHEGRTSPTIRGKAVRELFLCQPVPLPPANVDFALVQDVHNPRLKTARGRLTEHRDNPVCAGCHAVTDPIGLSLEHYDAVGAYRPLENGVPIDASGEFDGKSYRNALEFARILRESPAAPSCAATRVYEYGLGRSAAANDSAAIEQLTASFAKARYTFPALMREVATSPAFRTVAPPTVALNGEPSHGIMVAPRRP